MLVIVKRAVMDKTETIAKMAGFRPRVILSDFALRLLKIFIPINKASAPNAENVPERDNVEKAAKMNIVMSNVWSVRLLFFSNSIQAATNDNMPNRKLS